MIEQVEHRDVAALGVELGECAHGLVVGIEQVEARTTRARRRRVSSVIRASAAADAQFLAGALVTL
jgi:hypothetical protein